METRYYLLAVLDDAAQERLSALSDRLADEGLGYTRYTPYHITLWDGDSVDGQTLAHFDRICSTAPAVETALASVGLFGLAVVFLAPLPNQELLTLEQRICGRINDAPDGWVPHVTIRMGEPAYIKKAVPVIAGFFTPFPVRIERAELYECGENCAKLIRRFCLRGEEDRGTQNGSGI